MALKTTTIGAFPKPDFVHLPDWFGATDGPDMAAPTARWASALAAMGEDAEAILQRGTHLAVRAQVDAGIDIPTDGEIRRENYVHYHCRHLHGFDFEDLTEASLRNGAFSALLPTVRGPISVREQFLVRDWQVAQAATGRPVKLTLPGPLTVCDTVADAYYGDPRSMGRALAEALNVEVLSLAEAGCRHIQIDEPLFARKPADAIAYGMDNLERAFHNCPARVTRTMHMCCGYPDRLDNPEYPKADPRAYFELADAVDASSIQAVSLEDAHRPNDLSLLERFGRTQVILGVVGVASSRVETVEEVSSRLTQALAHIEADRLLAGPDCGLGYLGADLAVRKLTVMVEAARSV
ncbi:MAG: cobalamin-independent methionine synthase II family protein [Pseudomonadota bacterium]